MFPGGDLLIVVVIETPVSCGPCPDMALKSIRKTRYVYVKSHMVSMYADVRRCACIVGAVCR